MTPEEREELRQQYAGGVRIKPEAADRNVSFFHGTSDAVANHQVGDTIDPKSDHPVTSSPSHRSMIFMTDDMHRASFYAGQAVEKHGGNPVVYGLTPTGPHSQDRDNIRNPSNRQTAHPVTVNARHEPTDWQGAGYYRSQ